MDISTIIRYVKVNLFIFVNLEEYEELLVGQHQNVNIVYIIKFKNIC